MDTSLTQIAVLLDRSGSMGSVVKPTIDNFNEFVAQQRAAPGNARLCVAQFDHEYQFLYDMPINDVEKLTEETYMPRGSTALLDAIGRMVDSLGANLAAMPEHKRPGRVIVLILTDGYENASRHYTKERIRRMVKHQSEKYNWEFVFMGADQQSILDAKSYGIRPDSVFLGNISDPFAVSGICRYTTALRTERKQ